MQKKYHISLNENNDDDVTLIELLDSGSPSAIIKEALRFYLYADRSSSPERTNESDTILNLIDARFDALMSRIAEIRIAAIQNSIDPVNNIPVTWEPINPDDNTPFLRGIQKTAKPGMRL
jgi:hypothetical protein